MANETTIKKATNGTYYFRANLGFDQKTGKRIQKYRSGFRTKREAKEAYAMLVLQFHTESQEKNEHIPFGTFIEQTFLPWYQTQVKESTFLSRISAIRKHFAFFFDIYTDAIKPVDVQNWQLSLIQNGYNPNTVRGLQALLTLALDRAIILGLCEKNPSRTVGNVRKKKTDLNFWTLEEFKRAMSLLHKEDIYEHYLFISYTLLYMSGMRFGEASALSWDDIDLVTGRCAIVKTLYYRNQTDWKLTTPKTPAARRTIYLDKGTIFELESWKAVQQGFLPKCRFILSFDGFPTNKCRLPRALAKLAELAGLPTIRVHDLRHSHASLLIHMGASPLLIKERLGHENIETTLGTYAHLYPDTDREIASRLDGLLNGAE